jgi:hypothetical protein
VTISRCCVCSVCLVLIFCVSGCCAPESVSLPPDTPLPTTFVSPAPSGAPLLGSPTPTSTLKVSTSTPHPGRFRRVRITEQSVVGAYWSEDGQSVIYATSGERYGTIGRWWQYQVSVGERYPTEPPFNLNPEIWAQLEASYVEDAFVWFGGGISPSGARVVYNRLPLEHNYTPTPDEIYFPPYEAWTARLDGSDAGSLHSYCPYPVQAIWLDQERRILLVCSYEGGGGLSMASVGGSPPSDPLGGLAVSHWAALSPDETKLAFPDAFGTLHIAFLDSGEIRPVAQWGYRPNWSPDSRRLYYQHATEFADYLADIRVYDLDTGTDSLLKPWPSYEPVDALSVPTGGIFVVSPQENAAISADRGLWLVRWSP